MHPCYAFSQCKQKVDGWTWMDRCHLSIKTKNNLHIKHDIFLFFWGVWMFCFVLKRHVLFNSAFNPLFCRLCYFFLVCLVNGHTTCFHKGELFYLKILANFKAITDHTLFHWFPFTHLFVYVQEMFGGSNIRSVFFCFVYKIECDREWHSALYTAHM